MVPEPQVVLKALRENGVYVHHVIEDYRDPALVIVYLPGLLSMDEPAQTVARGIPGVRRVTFHPDTRAIMIVIGDSRKPRTKSRPSRLPTNNPPRSGDS